MNGVDEHIVDLLGAYLLGSLDTEREEELRRWLDEREENRRFFERFCADRSFRQRWEVWSGIDTGAAVRAFDRRTGGRVSHRKGWMRYVAVAALLVVALGVSWICLREGNAVVEEMIVPGGAKAVLVLSDGKRVDLVAEDSLSVGLASGVQVTNRGEELVYEGGRSEELRMNELQVPRGGEYTVVLSDGTKVRLNAASTLKYPEAFGGDRREVTLSGEGYFEVTKGDAAFFVRVGDLSVRVYGTTFNINAYKEECIRTALVAGKVGIRVANDGQEYLLKPSQLAEFKAEEGKVEIRDVDLAASLAWTKGIFVFNSEALGDILESLARWYDMDVFYQNQALKELHFTGYVKRYESIERILNALSQSVDVKFQVKGRTLVVSN